MERIRSFLTVAAMLFSVWSYGQNVTVQGKVTDASTKETVPFASLLGSYVLSVPRNATLIVSSSEVTFCVE